MAQNYTRQSTLSDGDTITASLFNDEYNQLVNAFTYSSTSASSTGHRHDGSSGQGGNIFKIGDLDFLNKIEVDSTNNRWGFYVEVSSAAVEQIRIQDGAVVPVTDNDIDLGTTSLEFKDLFIDGTAHIDTLDVDENATVAGTLGVTGTTTLTGNVTTTNDLSVGGNLTVTGTTTFNGGTITMGDAATDNVVFGADVDSNIIPDDDDTYDLGSSSQEWRNLYIDGTANIDSLVADTADINGGTIDGATIATSDVTVGSGKTLDVSAGTLTLADNQISGDKVEGGTIASTTITSLASTTVDTTNLEVTNIKAKDGTSAGSIADSTGVVTLASSVLTTTDINGGTIDGTTIGGTTTAAGSFTSVNATSLDVAGTVEFDGLSGTGAVSVTDILDQDDMSSNSATALATQQSIKSYVDSQVATVDTLSEVLGNGNTTGGTDIAVGTGDDITFADSSKAIFGAGNDLQIYHDGSASIIQDANVGPLKLLTNGLQIKNAADDENLITANQNGFVKLFYDNSAKLATTSTGVDVTGTVTADDVVVDDGVVKVKYSTDPASTVEGLQLTSHASTTGKFLPAITWGYADSSPDFSLIEATRGSSTGGRLHFATATSAGTMTERVLIDEGGDVAFYDDSGNKKLFWDASSAYLGVGSTTPNYLLDVEGSGSLLRVNATSGNAIQQFSVADTTSITGITFGDSASTTSGSIYYRHTGDSMAFSTDGVEALRIQSDKTLTSKGAAVFNEDSDDADFRIESDTNTHAFFLNGGNSRIGLNQSDPSNSLHIGDGTQGERILLETSGGGASIEGKDSVNAPSASFRIGHLTGTNRYEGAIGDTNLWLFTTTDLVFKPSGGERFRIGTNETVVNEASIDYDFRVESNNNTGMLFIDGGNDAVGIGTTSANAGLHVLTSRSGSYPVGFRNSNKFSGTPTVAYNMYSKPELADSAALSTLRGIDLDGATLGSGATLTNQVGLFVGNLTEGTNNYAIQTAVSAASGRYNLYLSGTADNYIAGALQADGGAVFNEASADVDFRVESNGNANMLFVDAGNDAVGIGTNSITGLMQLNKTSSGNTLQMLSLVNPVGAASTGVQLWMSGTNATSRGATIEAIAQSTANDHHMIFATSADASAPAERMRLFDTGKVRLGNSSDHVMVDVTASNAALQLIDNNQSNPPTLRGNGPNFTIENGGSEIMRASSNTEVVFNDGSADIDFRVESNGNTHALFVDAGNDKVGVGVSDPQAELFVRKDTAGPARIGISNSGTVGSTTSSRLAFYEGNTETSYIERRRDGSGDTAIVTPAADNPVNIEVNGGNELASFKGSSIIFNEDSGDQDFRVEGNSNSNLFTVDASTDRVAVGTEGPVSLLEVGSSTGSATITPTEMVISTRTSASDWATGASNQWGILGFYKADTSGGGAQNVAQIGASMSNSTAGYGNLHFQMANPGSSYAQTSWLTLQNSGSSANRQVVVDAEGGLSISGSGLEFTKTDGISISAAESLIVVIDSDDNDTGRVFQTQTGSGLVMMTNYETSGSVFNDGSNSEMDFRVESDSNANALFVDAGNDTVSVDGTFIADTDSGNQKFNITRSGASDQSLQIHVDDSGVNLLSHQDEADGGNYIFRTTNATDSNVEWMRMIYGSGVTFNEQSLNNDFRVESNNQTHKLFVDAGNDRIGINESSPDKDVHIKLKNNLEESALLVESSGSANYGGYIRSAFDTQMARFGALSQSDGGLDGASVAFEDFGRDIAFRVNEGGNNAERMRLDKTGGLVLTPLDSTATIFNEGSADSDFRVESNNNANMLFVDGANDTVGIGTNSTIAQVTTSTNTGKMSYYTQRVIGSRTNSASASGSSNAKTAVITITGVSLHGLEANIHISGHFWNNGNNTYYRHTKYYLMSEGNAARINDRTDEFLGGSQTGVVGTPSISLSGNTWTIQIDVDAGYVIDCTVYVEGPGADQITSITFPDQ